MKRSQRFLDWATPEQVGQRAFVERMEVALLREIAGISGESMLDVFLWKFQWPEYTDQLLSTAFAEWRYECDWYHARLTQTEPPPLAITHQYGHGLTHQIFWSTDFGRVALSESEQQEVSDIVTPLLANTPDDNREMVGQYLLALQCAGCAVPQDRLDTLLEWYDEPEWDDWADWKYHKYAVCAILCALRDD